MNLVELDRALKQLRLGGMASVLENRLLQAQNEHMAPIDLISVLSPTSYAVGPIASLNAAPTAPASATRRRPWTTSISTSTGR
jgi:hypothetical protein